MANESICRNLVDRLVAPGFRNENTLGDGNVAVLAAHSERTALTTASFISPDGADAVNTVANRLLSVGAFPRWLTLSLRIGSNADDALPAELTSRIGEAARLAETEIVSADMSIVAGCDDIELTLTALGIVRPEIDIDPGCAESGDAVILTGAVGSGSASLGDIVAGVFDVATPRAMSVPGRGGLEQAFADLRRLTGMEITVDKRAVPITAALATSGAAVMNTPCRGIMIIVVDSKKAPEALAACRRSVHGSSAAVIGRVG